MACLLLATSPTLAQGVDQQRLYVSDAKACALLEKEGVDARNDLDVTAMSTADGIRGMEFNCAFHGAMVKSGSDDACWSRRSARSRASSIPT
jgi:hypothetical protein